MREDRQSGNALICYFSKEKLEEFKDMPLRSRLQWLEDANTFINKVLGFEGRAVYDERYIGLKK